MISNITELLAKFDKIGFDTYENKEFTKGDWVLRYKLALSELFGAQLILNLYYRHKCVQSWGCVDGDDKKAVKWIKRKQYEIQEQFFKLEYDAENIGKKIFQEL